ncbi:UdgX family uracil-DNA binding protein [Sulfitobacter sp. D35]|uniref:UdgX family uracil-DNA binding protein n=1 Tax=Sulfitobacter sp. D35 TaxID=3083252 RepID=UPI00296F3821|nr:UdgX family uracil-DNA binding protein [Sulfitobacter sp. D35]MDW4498725.1 UdgX family uracil-DNA binding protein [Sulfitobacter sp. D35]
MRQVCLPEVGTFEAWRAAARGLANSQVPAQEVLWQVGGGDGDLFAGTEDDALPSAAGAPFTVPSRFMALANCVVWHRDPERFARLYALLLALRETPRLMADRGDARVSVLEVMAKAVRRDKHKMTAFVRFREIGEREAPRRRFVAWFEPSHLIVEPTAPFFAKRFGDMNWSILTPDLCAHFEDGAVRFTPGIEKPPLPEDATEDLWRTYFRNIFNPARLKVKAMQAEMPRKYWKNMPEAAMIPELVAGARQRAGAMLEAAPASVPARAARIGDRLSATRAKPAPVGDRAEFLVALQGCQRCPLWRDATQAVPGEGPPDAPLMIVGEQPGDHEDLAGRPFVGPAGQLFDRVAGEAGLDRSKAYVTNAVKHFKFVARGKRRLHQAPERDEIDHCRWWLDLERRMIRPKLILAMGGTALESLTGSRKGILKRRGGLEQAGDGTPLLVTVHPSYLLRLPSEERRQSETELFRADLRRTADLLSELSAA